MTADGGLHGTLTEREGAIWAAGDGQHVAVGFSDVSGNTEIRGYWVGASENEQGLPVAEIEERWSVSDLALQDTVVVDGTLVAPNEDAFTLLDIETGDRTDISVETELGSRNLATASGLAFHLYHNEILYAVDPAAEEVVWTIEEGLDEYTRMTATDDTVVLRSEDQYLAVDPQSGEFLAQGGDPGDAATVTADDQAVYSCGGTVTAHDAEF